MNRIQLEKHYWNNNAQDPDVDRKYICDIDTEKCLEDLHDRNGLVLEIGCGVGRLLENGDFGIDTSAEMTRIARRRKPNAKVYLNDGRTIPIELKFDYIYSYLLFQHLEADAVENYIKEAYKSLNSNGVFVFQWIAGSENEPFSKHFTYEQIDEWCNNFKWFSHEKSKAHQQWTITRCVK